MSGSLKRKTNDSCNMSAATEGEYVARETPKSTSSASHGEEEKYTARVLERGDLSGGYLTVQFLSGNHEWYEFCFRVRDNRKLKFSLTAESREFEWEDNGKTAYFTTLTRMKDGKDCMTDWLRTQVLEAIEKEHPELEVRAEKPFGWN